MKPEMSNEKQSVTQRWIVLFAVLTVLLALIVTVTGLTSAKYQLSTAGDASAKVAAYAVDAKAASIDDLTIDCSEEEFSADFAFEVTNKVQDVISEVAVEYTVQVELSQVLPEGVTMTLDADAGTASEDGKTYVFEDTDLWKFAPGTADKNDHILSFAVDNTVIKSNVTIESVKITVLAQQAG